MIVFKLDGVSYNIQMIDILQENYFMAQCLERWPFCTFIAVSHINWERLKSEQQNNNLDFFPTQCHLFIIFCTHFAQYNNLATTLYKIQNEFLKCTVLFMRSWKQHSSVCGSVWMPSSEQPTTKKIRCLWMILQEIQWWCWYFGTS